MKRWCRCCFSLLLISLSMIRFCRALTLVSRRSFHTSPRTSVRAIDDDELSWETFDYGDSPKWDNRFDTGFHNMVANKESSLKDLYQQETKLDDTYRKEQNQMAESWETLDMDRVRGAIAALEPFVQEKRASKLQSVLKQRTVNARFLFENPSNPSNVWACLRTVESFGIQCVDVVVDPSMYSGKAALSQKRGMRTAMGSAQWLTLNHSKTTKEAVTALQKEGYKVFVGDLQESQDVRDMQWPKDSKICIVMGNEERGISDEMRSLADGSFRLPMMGFAESFNLSVATAITLAHLSNTHVLRSGDMPEDQYQRLYLKGLYNSLSQKKIAKGLLQRANVELPKHLIND